MIRELPAQAAVYVYQQSFIPTLIFRIQGWNYQAADCYLQLFDSLTAPAPGAVPLKSFYLQAAFTFLYHESEGIPCKTGAYWALSSTDATFTALVAGGGIDLQVEIEEFQSLAALVTPESDLNHSVGAGGFVQITADTNNPAFGSVLFSKAVITPGSTQNLYFMLFAVSPVSGTTKPSIVRPITLVQSIPLLIEFGDQNGPVITYTDFTTQTLHNGLFYGLSTTGDKFTAYAGADMIVSAYYFNNQTPL